MEIIRNKKLLRQKLNPHNSVGFVATMGFLHQGHLSLVKKSKQENQITIVSIFVNPLQFGKNEDFETYPHDEEKDLALLKKENVDFVFLPEKDFYSAHHQTMIQNNFLKHQYCGATRKVHFDGVLTVVAKFFLLIQPQIAYFGEKDFQQFFLIQKMVQDLDFPITIKALATKREKNGLAMSSRNQYFSVEQKKNANFLYQSLCTAKEKIISGKNIIAVLEQTKKVMESLCSSVEYLVLVDEDNLAEVLKIEQGKNYRLLVAVYYCSVRLIDNLAIKQI